MEDKDLYERKRIHELVNSNISNSAKIDMIFEREEGLKEDINELKTELLEHRRKIEQISDQISAVSTSMTDLKKFFWIIVSGSLAIAGMPIISSLTNAI